MLILDTHVHIYSCYPPEDTLLASIKRMMDGCSDIATDCDTVFGLCLTERHDCNFFEQWKADPLSFPSGHLTIEPAGDDVTLLLRAPDHPPVYLFAGYQINTQERIEVLSLGAARRFDDKKPIRDTIEAVQDLGGIPVLCWAPGKWFFERGRIVKQLIDELGDKILLADTTLRPMGWPTPRLFTYGQSQGLSVIAGSDPLPFAGDEQYAGSYVTCYQEKFDPSTPAASLRHILLNNKHPILKTTRLSFPAVLKRLYRNAQ